MSLSSTSIFIGAQKLDQVISSNIVLADITDFIFMLESNRNYVYKSYIQFAIAGILSGFKFGVSSPAAPINHNYTISVFNSVGVSLTGIGINSSVGGGLANIGTHYAYITGTIENGNNTGNLSIQAAQNVSDIGALTIKRGSLFKVYTL